MLKSVLHLDLLARREPQQRFPTLVTSIETLAPPLQEAVRPYYAPEKHIVRIPPGYYPFRRVVGKIHLPYSWRQTPERIVVFEPDLITIIENDADGQAIIMSVERTALLKIHVFVFLLHSYFELVWVDGDHLETRIIEYNTVGEPLILHGLDRLRAAYPACLPSTPVEDRAEILARLPLKYRNYLRDSLLPDERLYTAIFQPAIRQETGLLHPYLSPDRAVGITERHITLVESRRDRVASEVGYSTDCCFYPLAQIQQISIEAMADASWLKLQYGDVAQTTEFALRAENAEALWAILQYHTQRESVL